MSDAGLDFSFAIGIFDPARQSDSAVVSQHVAIEWIQSGIVDVGDEHAFAQVIEHDDARTAAESTEGFLVQLGPDARTGAEGQQAYRLAAAAQRQHEQSCASILAGLRIADHRAVAVIDLGLFSRRGDDHGARLRWLVSAQLANEAFDGLIAAAEPTARTPGPARSPWHCDRGSDPVRSPHETVRRNWWTEWAWDFLHPRRFTPRQTRWSPRWPVLRFAFAFPFVERFSGLGLTVAGFAASDPVVTSLAGFAGGRRPHAPGGRTPIPAAFR